MTINSKLKKPLGLVVCLSHPRPGERGGSVAERRGFLALTALLLYLPLIAARAQPESKAKRVALLEAGAPSANQHFLEAFMAGMRELGYVPGRNVLVDVRWAEGRVEGFRRALDELIGLRPDVIVVSSTLGAVETMKATSSIPVIFVGVPDPEGNGLVTSLARPGGNITGLARTAGEGITHKSVQLLRELVPGVTRMAILWNPEAITAERRGQVMSAAQFFGITPLAVEVRERDGIGAAFATMRKERANALFVIADPLTLANRNEIVKVAASERIPAAYEFSEFARAGGLIAYAPSVTDQFRRAAAYADKILRGAKPGDLPVEQPTKFELVINLNVAKALGITVPRNLLLRADEVIQ